MKEHYFPVSLYKEYTLLNGHRAFVIRELNNDLLLVYYSSDKTVGKIGRDYFGHIIKYVDQLYRPVDVPPQAIILYGS